MAVIPEGPLTPNQMQYLRTWLRTRLSGSVAIEVWSREESGLYTGDRDVNAQGWMSLALMRQMKSLHPSLTLTPYDLDSQVDAAAERGIEDTPTLIMRARGRSIRCVGVFFGAVFQPFLDQLGYLSTGRTPLAPATLERLAAIEDEVTIDAYVSAFDPVSLRMIPLLGALAVAGGRIRVTQVEGSQFPILMGKRFVTQMPTLSINGQRFLGHYNESQLVEQIERVLSGSTEPVVRDRVLTTPYVSDAEMRQRVEAQAAAAQAQRASSGPASGTTPGSGLYIPGR